MSETPDNNNELQPENNDDMPVEETEVIDHDALLNSALQETDHNADDEPADEDEAIESDAVLNSALPEGDEKLDDMLTSDSALSFNGDLMSEIERALADDPSRTNVQEALPEGYAETTQEVVDAQNEEKARLVAEQKAYAEKLTQENDAKKQALDEARRANDLEIKQKVQEEILRKRNQRDEMMAHFRKERDEKDRKKEKIDAELRAKRLERKDAWKRHYRLNNPPLPDNHDDD